MTHQTSSQQKLIDECSSPNVTELRLLELLADPRMMVKANAIFALAKREPEEEHHVVDALVSLAHSETARRKVIGTLNERMLAAFGLAKIGSPLAQKRFEELRAEMSEEEQQDLEWNIENNDLG